MLYGLTWDWSVEPIKPIKRAMYVSTTKPASSLEIADDQVRDLVILTQPLLFRYLENNLDRKYEAHVLPCK
ncbi:hypothetical protein SUNI508_02231 [Seiridium unicorne]|uniref:Uncharacterized protein n=1 Tax=Seiridium unicorne TaxID=138068 RepID=A0ABR2UHX8_9PEZI